MKLGRALAAPPPEIRMILPERFSIIGGSATRHELATPIRLISTVSFHAFGLLERNGPIGPCTPAAVIRMSSPPKLLACVPPHAPVLPAARTSARRRMRLPAGLFDLQFGQIQFRPGCAPAAPRAAPSAANPIASRLPMPRPAPVIKTLFL